MARPAESNGIERLIGVYDAKGSVPGEIAYWIGARLGTRHCALCEITHGIFREKAEWTRCISDLSIPFEALHLDELTPALTEAVGGRAPCVVAERAGGELEIVIDRDQLESCEGQPARLAEMIEALS